MTAPLLRPESAYAHYLPYWWIGDQALVLADGALAIGYRFRGVDPACLTDGQVNTIAHQLRTLLNALPIGLQCQILRHARPAPEGLYAHYLAALTTRDPILTEQRHRSAAHLRALQLRTIDTYLLFSQPRALGRLGSHVRSPLSAVLDRLLQTRDPAELTYEQHVAALDDLTRTCDGLIRHLRAAGVGQLERLDDAGLTALVYGFLNPSREDATPVLQDDRPPPELDEEQLQLFRPLSLREQLAHTSLSWDVDSLTLDDPMRLHRVMGLKTLPPRTIASLIHGAARLTYPHWLSVGLSVPDSERKYVEVERRRNRAKATATGFARDVKASLQAEELEHVLEAMVSRDQRVFSLSLNLLFGADTLTELDTRTRQAVDVFRQMASTVVATEQMGQLPAFLGMLPGNAHRAPHRRSVLTDNAADLLPIYDPWPGDSRPSFLVTTRHGEPLAIDLADPRRTNWNCTVFGGSGGGKSFLTLSLATSTMLGQDSPLIVIDVGGKELGSYYRLANLLGGDFVGLSLDGSTAINPFYSREDLYTTDEGLPSAKPNELKLAFLLSIAKLLVSDPGSPPLTRVQEGILQRGILAAYRRLGAARPPLFDDLVQELEQLPSADAEDTASAKRFAKTLRATLDGPFGKLVNQQSRVTVRSSFVVFDLKGLETLGDLASVMLLIVSAYVWNMIARPRTNLAWVVYDECWKLLMSPTAAALQSELYRTARKLRTGVVSITQKLEDFLAAPAAKAILSNTTTTFLLKHKDGHAAVAELLSLNDRELELFRGLKAEKGLYSEFFLKQETGAAVARYAPNPFEYWVNTTDPADRDLEARVLAELAGDRLAALRRLAADYPNGASRARSSHAA